MVLVDLNQDSGEVTNMPLKVRTFGAELPYKAGQVAGQIEREKLDYQRELNDQKVELAGRANQSAMEQELKKAKRQELDDQFGIMKFEQELESEEEDRAFDEEQFSYEQENDALDRELDKLGVGIEGEKLRIEKEKLDIEREKIASGETKERIKAGAKTKEEKGKTTESQATNQLLKLEKIKEESGKDLTPTQKGIQRRALKRLGYSSEEIKGLISLDNKQPGFFARVAEENKRKLSESFGVGGGQTGGEQEAATKYLKDTNKKVTDTNIAHALKLKKQGRIDF